MFPKNLTTDPNFAIALEFTLGAEGVRFDQNGKVVNDGYNYYKSDPGGETIWGLSHRFMKSIGYKGKMKDISLPKAVAIYQQYFWDATRSGALPWELGTCMFDCAVNLGQGDAEACLRHADGSYRKFNSWRLGIYNENVKKGRANRRDLRGWINRVVDLNKYIDITAQKNSTSSQVVQSPQDSTDQSAVPKG